MTTTDCRRGGRKVPGWLALGVSIGAGWAFLIGLYLGLTG